MAVQRTWLVMRQDDHGNRFVVREVASESAGQRMVRVLTARGHKQIYWCEQGAIETERMTCPRCGQDWLMSVSLAFLAERAVWCAECDALWSAGEAPRADNWEDRSTFLRKRGQQEQEADGVEVCGFYDPGP